MHSVNGLAAVDPGMTDRNAPTAQIRPHQALELGLNYLTGNHVPRDPARAAQLLQQAAQAGEPEAQTRLGMMYQTGTGVPQDFALAMHWYQLASSSGGLGARVNMGILYARGQGTSQDVAMALRLFHDAFRRGYAGAAAYLGEVYFAGTGVQRDQKTAEEWFIKGMKRHDPVSSYDLGVLYSGEYGHAQNLPRAAEMFRKSASFNYVPAEYLLGLLIARHPEFGVAPGEAQKWLEAASEAGFWKANAVLGILSRDGDGVPKQAEQALYYFKLAAVQGGASAQKLVALDLNLLVAGLPAEKVAEISLRADAWAKEHPPQFLMVNSGTGEMTLGTSIGISPSPAAGVPQVTLHHPPPS